MSSALSFANGRGMSVSDRTAEPLTLTSKQPLRGFSSLTLTTAPGKPALTRASSLVARVLNAPQLLHASIETTAPPEDAAGTFLADAAVTSLVGAALVLFLAIVFLGGIRSENERGECRCE